MDLRELNSKSNNNRKNKKVDSKFNLKITRPKEGFIGQLEIVGAPKILGAGEVGLVLTYLQEKETENKKYYIFGFSTANMEKNFIVSVKGVQGAENKSIDIEGLQIPDARIPGQVRKLIYTKTLRSFLKENLQTEDENTQTENDDENTENPAKSDAIRDFNTESDE